MINPDTANTVKQLLIEILSLDLQASELDNETVLLGNIPEFDSMAIVSVITAIEEEFGFIAEDDDLTAETFESIGSLIGFVEERL